MAKEIALTQGKVALVDDEDFEWLSQWKWFASLGQKRRNWYARRSTRASDGTIGAILMHRLLMSVSDPKILVDHASGDGLDNRRQNLRLCDTSGNCKNKRKRFDCSSAYKGVCWVKRDKKWSVTIKTSGGHRFIGHFRDETAAALAYDAAARTWFGEFAALNFPKPGERSCLTEASSPAPSRRTG